jgi:hypothetical protein
VPAEALNAFEDQLVECAKATEAKDAPLMAGSHCRFCPALSICPAQLEMISELATADFKPIVKREAPVLPPADALTITQLSGILKCADQIAAWLKAVEAHALNLLNHGEEVPGFKLVKKKANRRWIDQEEARSALSLYMSDEEMLTAPTLKSPAQIEKALKKAERELIKPYIEAPDTGTTIAEDSDPREAIQGGSAVTDFKTIEK